MKTSRFCTQLTAVSFLAFGAMALAQIAPPQSSSQPLVDTGSLSVSSYADFVTDMQKNPNGKYQGSVGIDNLAVDVRAMIMKDVYLNLQGNLAQDPRDSVGGAQYIYLNGQSVPMNVPLESLLQDATITVTNVKDKTGLPIASITFGKLGEAAFGQGFSEMPLQQQTTALGYDASRIQRVTGLTVTLDKSVLLLFDSAQISAFNSETDSTNPSKIDSFSFRVTKDILNTAKAQVTAEASYAYLGNSSISGAPAEQRASVGVIGKTKDGKWTVYAEGIHIDNNQELPGSNLVANLGIARKLGPGQVAIEYSHYDQAYDQVAGAYWFSLSKNLEIGPEIGYQWANSPDGQNGIVLGADLHVDFSSDTHLSKPMFGGSTKGDPLG